MKPEVGKYYKNRKGEVKGPVKYAKDYRFNSWKPSRNYLEMYPFEINHSFYCENGLWSITRESNIDLIEECNPDGSPILTIEELKVENERLKKEQENLLALVKHQEDRLHELTKPKLVKQVWYNVYSNVTNRYNELATAKRALNGIDDGNNGICIRFDTFDNGTTIPTVETFE